MAKDIVMDTSELATIVRLTTEIELLERRLVQAERHNQELQARIEQYSRADTQHPRKP